MADATMNNTTTNSATSRLRDTLEQDLVETVCKWMRRVFTVGPGIATLLHFSKGHSPYTYMMPCLVNQTALWLGCSGLPAKQQVATLVTLIVPTILSIVLQEGCTASMKPAVFGLFPSACAFVFRTPFAVKSCTLGVVLATLVVFALDATGQCPTSSLTPQDIPSLIGDRLLPLLMLLGGNCVLLLAIVQQSQTALQVQTQAALQAAELASVRRDVLHRLTHELRTPLNGIVGSVDLLVSSERLQLPQHAEDFDNVLTIQRCLDTMLRICDDVLAAAAGSKGSHGSRQPRGQQQPASGGDQDGTTSTLPPQPPFLLVSCLDKVTDVFAASAAAKGLLLKTEFSGNLTSMVVNHDNDTTATDHTSTPIIKETELIQVLLNLVGNAIKFAETGSIAVRIRTDANTNVTTTFANNSSDHENGNNTTRVTFEVQDTGVGAATETAHLLFEPFHQGERGAVSRRHPGTGLGLSICQELVKSMGGTLQVETDIGKGARFYFSLDLNLQHDKPHQQQQGMKNNNALPTQISQQQQVSSPSVENSDEAHQVHVAIMDSQLESRVSCQSMVASIAPPNAVIHLVDTPIEVLDLATKNSTDSSALKARRFLFMEAKNGKYEDFTNSLVSLRRAGWVVFQYADYDVFPALIKQQSTKEHMHAIFRRPLPLVQIGKAFREMLEGGPLSTSNLMQNSGGLTKTTLAVTNAPTEITPAEDREKMEARGNLEGLSIQSICNETTRVVASPVKKQAAPTPADATKYPPGARIVVVDDTPMNVKVLTKLLSKQTSLPIVSCLDGQSSIDLVKTSSPDDIFLILMDWHMPGNVPKPTHTSLFDLADLTTRSFIFSHVFLVILGLCGLQATEAIRKTLLEQKGKSHGPSVYVCMVTADIEGLQIEMNSRGVSCEGIISEGKLLKNSHKAVASEMETGRGLVEDSFNLVDLVTGKPVNIALVRVILDWFQQKTKDL